MRDQFKCSICHRPTEGHGNNAWPVNKGKCCNRCNTTVVIPARIDLMKKEVKDASDDRSVK